MTVKNDSLLRKEDKNYEGASSNGDKNGEAGEWEMALAYVLWDEAMK